MPLFPLTIIRIELELITRLIPPAPFFVSPFAWQKFTTLHVAEPRLCLAVEYGEADIHGFDVFENVFCSGFEGLGGGGA